MLDTVVRESFQDILDGIEAEIGAGAYGLWFRGCVFGGLRRGVLRVGVRTELVREWIERNYLDVLDAQVRQVIGAPLKLEIAIDPELQRRHRDEVARADAAPAPTANEGDGRPRFSTFVPTAENRFAYGLVADSLQPDAANPPASPLVIVGDEGSGKTHLLSAFRRPKNAAKDAARPLFTDALEFTGQFTMAVKTRDVESFRAFYERFDIIVFDQLERLAGKKATQAEFIALLKRWAADGRRVVIASRQHPRQMNDLAPGLCSLLLGGMVAQIRPYSRRSLEEIVGHAVGVDRRPVDPEVVRALARDCRSDVRELQARLIRVCGYASLQGQVPTAEFVQKHFAELVSPARDERGGDRVLDEIVRHFDVDRSDLLSKSKRQSLRLPRAVAACVLRERMGLTLKEVGRLLGGRSHTSICLLVSRYSERIAASEDLRQLADRLADLGGASAPRSASEPTA